MLFRIDLPFEISLIPEVLLVVQPVSVRETKRIINILKRKKKSECFLVNFQGKLKKESSLPSDVCKYL